MTTAYHPASNGLVERRHRQLKTALKSHADTTAWIDNLPLVLLDIRSAVKENIQCTTAEPSKFVQSSTINTSMSNAFVQQLKQCMAQLRPTPTRLTPRCVFVQDNLKVAPFVFVRHDAVRKPFCFSYDGLCKVLKRMDKHYVIQKADKTDTVSIDRLKPAYLECIPLPVVPSHSSALSPPIPPVSSPSHQPSHSITPTMQFATPFSSQRISSRFG
ncbi:unnamed protein product [Schistocephalus solidus]|uniref:Integrase catalytic domain-containing protein n=1 Tax=Schistocephalus solidus TaxID=70667 RepID=A0A183T0T6_SCHSO|nr:unnamed protein product [Schistocephalus solidus]